MISTAIVFMLLVVASYGHQAFINLLCGVLRHVDITRFIHRRVLKKTLGYNPGYDDQNTNSMINPLFNLTKQEWWMRHANKARFSGLSIRICS